MYVNHFDDQLFGEGGLEASRIVIASVGAYLITTLSVAAGIGGGGLLVPLYFVGVDQTQAVSLSKGTIFGVARPWATSSGSRASAIPRRTGRSSTTRWRSSCRAAS